MSDTVKPWWAKEADRRRAIQDAERAKRRFGDPPKESNTGNSDYDNAYNKQLRPQPMRFR